MPNQFIATQLSSNANNPSSHASNQNDNAAPVNQIEITNVFEEISSYMTLDDINIAARVSKRWNQLFSSPEVWNKAFCERFEISKDSLISAMLKLEKLPNIKRRLEAKFKLLENSKDQLTHSQFIVTSYKRKLALLMCCADQAEEFLSLISTEEYPFWFDIAVKLKSINVIAKLASGNFLEKLKSKTLEDALSLLALPKFNLDGKVNHTILNAGLKISTVLESQYWTLDKLTIFLLDAIKANNQPLVNYLFEKKYGNGGISGFIKRMKDQFDQDNEAEFFILLSTVIETGDVDLLKKFLSHAQFNKAFQKLSCSESIVSALLSGSREMLLFIASKKQLEYVTLMLSQEQLESIINNNQLALLKEVLSLDGPFKMDPEKHSSDALIRHAIALANSDLVLFLLQNHSIDLDDKMLSGILTLQDKHFTHYLDYIYDNIQHISWSDDTYETMLKKLKEAKLPISQEKSTNIKNALPLIIKPIFRKMAANNLSVCQSLTENTSFVGVLELDEDLLVEANQSKNLAVIDFLYKKNLKLAPVHYYSVMNAMHFPLFKCYYDNDLDFRKAFHYYLPLLGSQNLKDLIYTKFRFEVAMAQYLGQIAVLCSDRDQEKHSGATAMFAFISRNLDLKSELKHALSVINWKEENIEGYLQQILTIADRKDLNFLLQLNVKFDQSHFETAVSSSNLVAVEYFLESSHSFTITNEMLMVAAKELNYPLFKCLSSAVMAQDKAFELDADGIMKLFPVQKIFPAQDENISWGGIHSIMHCHRITLQAIEKYKTVGLSKSEMEMFKSAYQHSSQHFCQLIEAKLPKDEVEKIYSKLEIHSYEVPKSLSHGR